MDRPISPARSFRPYPDRERGVQRGRKREERIHLSSRDPHGGLGQMVEGTEPLIFATELVAFFATEGLCRLQDDRKAEKRGPFYGFSRTADGLVKTRTDGKRLFVYTDSGNIQLKEAYAYQLDSSGVPQPDEVTRA
jgi:hypothetical protein